MGQHAPRVMVETGDIARLRELILQLPGNARVRVQCADGSQYGGIVCVRPTAQSFRDRDGNEGINGVLRLEDTDAPGGERHLWLDQLVRVHRLDGIEATLET